MAITFSGSVLIVKDIQVSKKFYTEVLGEEVLHDFGKNVQFKSGVSVWELRETHIIPQELGDRTVGNSNRFELYYETTDLAETLEHLAKFEIEYLHPEHTEPWGQKTIRFFDPDLHLVEIGETLHAFVGRMHGENYSIKDISSATHIPICTVEKLISEIESNKHNS